jgi:flagellar basal-body rod protein FlgG
MIRGIYTAVAGLATATLRLGAVSNNMANATTPGYRQDRLPEELGRAIDLARFAVDAQGRPVGNIALGPKVGISQLDLTPGPIKESSNPLDLAIAGSGFFGVQAADGTQLYTRDGGFHAAVDGSLRTRDGLAVMDTNGQPITIPTGADVSIAADGTVQTAGRTLAQLQLVDFPNGQQLTKIGNGMFTAPVGAQTQPLVGAQVYQGYLEGSNVDLSESMVATMNLVRAYESNQKMLQMQDETLKSTVNEVGRA